MCKVYIWCQECVLDVSLLSDLVKFPKTWRYGHCVTAYFLQLSDFLLSFSQARSIFQQFGELSFIA